MLTPAMWTGMYYQEPLDAALRLLHAGGWKTFEVSDEHLEQLDKAADAGAQIEAARRVAALLGLQMPQAHAHLAADVAHPDEARRHADLEHLRRHLDLAARLGAKWIALHPGGGASYTSRAERERIVRLNREAFEFLGDHAAARGLTLGLENMMDRRDLKGWRRFGAAPGDLLELLDALRHPALGVTLDTSHANVQRLEIGATVRELGPRLCCTHISDNDGSSDQHRSPGGGTVDWPALMAALKEIRYAGLFNLEIPGERHALPALRALRVRHAFEIASWLVTL
jgi:sugar phosphate isomerase/epimerase